MNGMNALKIAENKAFKQSCLLPILKQHIMDVVLNMPDNCKNWIQKFLLQILLTSFKICRKVKCKIKIME